MKHITQKLFFILILLIASQSYASHIVGGDLTVKWVSGNSFDVTLQFFRDCSAGNADFDASVDIGLFDKVTNNKTIITINGFTRTNISLGDACFTPSLCLQKGVYTKRITIPNNANGYYLSYNRCCRNAAITNITNPDDAGFVFYCEIPNPSLHNSSPTFTQIPDGYMCRNYLNTDNFSCTDADGDQLVYSFSPPLDCSQPNGMCKNITTSTGFGTALPGAQPKPYGSVTWSGSFSLANPMGDATMAVNSSTGIVTTTPPFLGIFVYCVKVEEYRNGVKLGEIRRDFQFQVTSACTNLNVQYNNTPICLGASKTLTVNGANPPFKYSWAPGGQTTSSIVVTPTASGTYNYSVTATNGGCVKKAYASVVINDKPIPSVVTSGNVCLAQNTTLTASGGVSYNWIGPTGNAGNTASIAPSTNGTYTVTVTNAAGCTATATGFVYNAPLLNTTINIDNVACSGNPANASINATGGSPSYSYLWSNGKTTATVTGLVNGSYTVTTTDVQGCTSQKTFNINITSTPSVSASSTQSGCTVSNGTASAIVSGGTGAPSYLWTPSGQTTPIATGLATGTYTVTVTSTGCSGSTTVTISPTPSPTVTTSATNTGCTVSNGTATANPSGGTGIYTYLWSPTNQTTSTATGLFSGVYTILISDENGCTDTETATVVGAGGPTASTTVNSNVSCFGGSDGAATVNPIGGTPNYTYSWDNGATTQAVTGLPAGTYVATVTDANGCIYSAAAIIVTQPTQSLTTTTAQQTEVSCFGGNDGIATANPTGGTPSYTFLWSNAQSTQFATGLSAGTYSVNITDANGCTTTNTVTITQPANALSSTISAQTNVSCFGGNNGDATALPTGGTSGYTYLWNNGQTTQTATGLTVGSYTVGITDFKGCAFTNTVNITQPAAILTSTISAQVNVSCFGGNDGSATTTPSGGTISYTYLWNNGQTSQTVTGLSMGTHTVDITDALGCTATATVDISQPAAALSNMMFPQVNVSCFGGNDGYVSANPQGGTSPYSYLWNTGTTTQTISNLISGTYSVNITDAMGCTYVDTATIFQPKSSLVLASATQQNITCNGGNNGSASITLSGGTLPYYYSWSNGDTTQTITGLTQGTYSVIVFDDNGCSLTDSIIITQPTGVSVLLNGNDSICPGGKSKLSVTASGGTPSYYYSWQPGSLNGASVNVSPSTTTIYSAMAMDANGCVSTAGTFTVTVMPQAIALIDTTVTGTTFNPIYHFNNPNGGNIDWYWDFGDGSGAMTQNVLHVFPAPGEYNVMHITNNIFGCPDTFYVEIFIPDTFFIPNIFTPSGNGKNDTWIIPNTGFKNAHLEIFDRWGIKVYESDAPTISWDGHTYSGKMLSDGTYYFIADIDMKVPPGSKPKKIKLKGPITLLSHDK